MNRYGSTRDTTMRGPGQSPGVHGRRKCFGCNGNKAELGGRVHRRNRQWYRAGCAAAWENKRPETT